MDGLETMRLAKALPHRVGPPRGHRRQSPMPPPTGDEGKIAPGNFSEKNPWPSSRLRVWDSPADRGNRRPRKLSDS